jgi:hypothetical protein
MIIIVFLISICSCFILWELQKKKDWLKEIHKIFKSITK